MSDAQPQATTHSFQAEVHQVLRLVINSLYSNKEIFLRELISNASDALDKLRFRALTEQGLTQPDETLSIRLTANKDAGTLTISDNGVGMTRDELIRNLGTVAHSGSREFLQKLQTGNADLSLIGQFGVGFYSAYLVADRVEVVSRAASSDEAWRWISSAQETFTVEPTSRDARGTDITLHLRDDQRDFLETWKLRSLIQQYSDFVSHPIQLQKETYKDEDADDADAKPEPTGEFETVNQASALWRRKPSEVTDDQYADFYKHITHDWEGPLARAHFQIEGSQVFTGLLFVPKRPPFDLFERDQRHGVRLYVKRVFIMDDCEELLPRWLRFLRGVIDSEDLPLNVSRELLQDSSITRNIRKQVTKKALDMIADLATERPDDYLDFWRKYGLVLKEGVHFEPNMRDKIAGLLRFDSSRDEGLTSLASYVERMPAHQKAIYYIATPNKSLATSSPQLEAVRKRGFEVLYFTDTIDQWVADNLRAFQEKDLVSVLADDLDLGEETEVEKLAHETHAKDLLGLTSRFETVLGDQIKQVRVSKRLTDSPVCLVLPEGGLPSHVELLLRAHQQDMPKTRRIMEVNPNHPLISNLQKLHDRAPEDNRVHEWIELLYDQALLAEGSPIPDPARFTARMTRLVQDAASAAVSA